MKHPLRLLAASIATALVLYGCGGATETAAPTEPFAAVVEAPATPAADAAAFQYEADRFADIRILRYQIPGFEALSVQQKKLLYFLSQAGMSGRDMMYDQNYRHNLRVRKLLEQIVQHYAGDRATPEFTAFMTYAKQVWFANGMHHH